MNRFNDTSDFSSREKQASDVYPVGDRSVIDAVELTISLLEAADNEKANYEGSETRDFDFHMPSVWAGKFTIGKLLGQGGMGDVYSALDNLNREVALKVLNQKSKGREQQLLKEAMDAGKVQHPNVVPVFEADIVNGQAYLSMQLMIGSVASLLTERGKLTPLEVIEISIQAAKGLHAAHQAGIIHYDMKPHNLLLNRFGDVLVSDFGLSRTVLNEMNRLVSGTPTYMSPEQAMGDKIDYRSDIYSLGATMFELLTGRQLFEDLSTKEKILAHITKAAPNVRLIDKSIPDILAKIVGKCLKKDLAHRYQSMEELILDLEIAKKKLRPQIKARVISAVSIGLILLAGGVISALMKTSGDPVASAKRKINAEKSLSQRAEQAFAKFREMNPEITEGTYIISYGPNKPVELRIQKGTKVENWQWLKLFGPDLVKLEAPDCSFSDSSCLSECVNLEYVNLSYNPGISDLSGLTGIKVKILEARDTNLSSLDFLKGNDVLEKLVINRTNVEAPEYRHISSQVVETIIGTGDKILYQELTQRFPEATIDLY